MEVARSRNIKPGFFLNYELAQIDPLGRLLFAGLWCIADREGRLEDQPPKIKVQTLPYDTCDTESLLNKLADSGFIRRYSVNGKRYIQVMNWHKHQNPHVNEASSTIPAPEEYGTSMVQVPEEYGSTTADSLNLIPDSLNLIPDCSDSERLILHELKQVINYPLDFAKDLAHIRSLAVDFPDVDLLDQAKRWRTYKLDKPLEKKSNARLQFRTWVSKAKEFAKGGVPRGGQRHSGRTISEAEHKAILDQY